MSIELKEAAQQAIEAIQDLRGYRPDIDKAIEALRTAIQQVEAQQPATTEPVQTTPNFTQLMQILDGLNRCHSRDSKVEFLRSWIRDWTQHKVDKLTHPAPSVPGDDFDLICNAIDKADTITMADDDGWTATNKDGSEKTRKVFVIGGGHVRD